MPSRSSVRLTVDLGNIASNYAVLSAAMVGGRCGAVVKADGYGLGAERVFRTLLEAGCSDFFVASVGEGRALRAAVPGGIGVPGAGAPKIFIFSGVTNRADVTDCVAHDLIPVINSDAQLNLWRQTQQAPMALHIDTGMERLGMPWRSFDAGSVQPFNVCMLITHLACADDGDHPLNAQQVERFRAITIHFQGVETSIGNSAGVFLGPPYQGDVGRPGIALYGGETGGESVGESGGENGGDSGTGSSTRLQPVATFEGQVLQLRSVPAGASIGYGATNTSTSDRTIAVVGLGYADGLPRSLSNVGEAFVNGHRVPIVGRVSMDLTDVDVSAAQGVAVGDWVEFLGANVRLDAVAVKVGTIGYELLTGLASVEKHYRSK